MKEEYFSIASPFRTQCKVEGSKFIADVFPVNSEEEAKTFLTNVRKEFFDATHHCFAYCIGESRSIVRASDDGEPSGTAGHKIMSAIDSHGLSDILVVVTRYFGGTNLGVGGLGRAYFDSANSALLHCKRVHKVLMAVIQISFPFDLTNVVMNLITQGRYDVVSRSYAADASILHLHIPQQQANSFHEIIQNASKGRIGIDILREEYITK